MQEDLEFEASFGCGGISLKPSSIGDVLIAGVLVWRVRGPACDLQHCLPNETHLSAQHPRLGKDWGRGLKDIVVCDGTVG